MRDEHPDWENARIAKERKLSEDRSDIYGWTKRDLKQQNAAQNKE